MSSSSPLRVLLVDDEPGVAVAARALLSHAGHQVVVESDSRKALALLQGNPRDFDLALVDHYMPHLTGIELIRLVRSEGLDSRIVLMSGWLSPALEREARDLGVTHLLEKPFGRAELMALLQQVLTEAPTGVRSAA